MHLPNALVPAFNDAALAEREKATLAISGGTSPKLLFRFFAGAGRDWNTPANWTPAAVPSGGGGNFANINNGTIVGAIVKDDAIVEWAGVILPFLVLQNLQASLQVIANTNILGSWARGVFRIPFGQLIADFCNVFSNLLVSKLAAMRPM